MLLNENESQKILKNIQDVMCDKLKNMNDVDFFRQAKQIDKIAKYVLSCVSKNQQFALDDPIFPGGIPKSKKQMENILSNALSELVYTINFLSTHSTLEMEQLDMFGEKRRFSYYEHLNRVHNLCYIIYCLEKNNKQEDPSLC